VQAVDDPFAGISQRYVAPEDVSASDMEVAAASDALQAAGIEAGDLGLIIGASVVPDLLVSNNACRLHHRLGAPPACPAIAIDAACNAFLLGLSLAVPMWRAGGLRYALLVQSSNISRVLDYERPGSQYFGDCATAVVIGHVSAGRGLLTDIVSHTDGSLNAAAAIGRRGQPWHGEGRAALYAPDPVAGRRLAVVSLEKVKRVADAVFQASGCTPGDVDFLCTHQGYPWMRQAMKECLEVPTARDVDTFTTFGNCSGANLPLALGLAVRQGLLRDDDLVLMGGVGAGATVSAALVRWGG
jgi:3-oxoacyl-[acyl-carrier-protein] synthase III